jgi:Fur family peroxide stress response transcriptional regulator
MSKLNLTIQRKAVYETVQKAHDHPTAADIIDRLRETGHNFAYGTVYNSLRYLADAGLILEVQLGDTASRYDGRVDDHQHIVCQRCGRVDEVLSAIPPQWLQIVAEETNYLIDNGHVVFTGVCSTCRDVS